jgi:hypothetical protein
MSVVTYAKAEAEMQQAVSQWFRLQSPEFRAEGVRLLMTHCDIWLNIQGDYVEMQDITLFFGYDSVLFSRQKSCFE